MSDPVKFVGKADLFDMRSTSGGENVYRVVLGEDDDDSTCTCPAFFYHTRKAIGPGEFGCKHIAYVTHLRDTSIVPEQAHPDVERMVVDAFAQGFKAGARGLVAVGR